VGIIYKVLRISTTSVDRPVIELLILEEIRLDLDGYSRSSQKKDVL